MAARSAIEWTDATWNPITGCSVVSPGCTHCYAMRLAGTRMQRHPSRAGLTTMTKAGPVWNGQVRFNEAWLTQPLQWKRPRRVFVCAHGDLFHEDVPDEWIDRVFAVMALCPQHTFQVLTKRSKRMLEYLSHPTRSVDVGLEAVGLVMDEHANNPSSTIGSGIIIKATDINPGALKMWPLPNLWLGVSTEDQQRADERIPDLLATPAAMRFVSAEPLLGPIDLTEIDLVPTLLRGRQRSENDPRCTFNALTGATNVHPIHGVEDPFDRGVDLVIGGGESGPGARPMHPEWARGLRDQCAAAGVPFFFKQWGEWAPVCAMSEEQIDACYHPAPELHPEASRREKVRSIVLHSDGDRFDGESKFHPPAFWQGSGAMMMFETGKARAGRLLDGVEHNGMPEPRGVAP